MKKNYYEILEVDKNASQDVIKKAYTTLAKKYHPDLQNSDTKKIYEEKLKTINEAYYILSNEEKRKEYDIFLSENNPDIDNLLNENSFLKNELNNMKKNSYNNYNNSISNNDINNNYNYENDDYEFQKQVQAAREQAYYDAYIQDLKNRGYKIKYKKTLKDYFKAFVSLYLTIIILLLIFQIPFIKNTFLNLYENNFIVKAVIDAFISIFKK